MTKMFSAAYRLRDWLDHASGAALPTLARLVFAGVLFMYFMTSALTKLSGVFTPSDGAYIQIFPRVVEGFGYDFSKLGWFHWTIVLAGSYAEIILPLLIVAGLLTRLASLAMMGFVVVQTATDVFGHGVMTGEWFDSASDAVILDQRTLWLLLLAILLFRGAGPLSVDRLLFRQTS